MLVLTRHVGESIRISGGIVVKVLRSVDGAIRLGIQAPDDVLILRDELEPFAREGRQDVGDDGEDSGRNTGCPQERRDAHRQGSGRTRKGDYRNRRAGRGDY